MIRILPTIVLCCLAALAGFTAPASRAAAADADQPFHLRDDDRVVLLGGTYIERMQSYGYLETLLTAAQPDLRVSFRNLGWSGDDVTGIARAVFGSPADGFQRLRTDVLDAQPTVIVICYGANEANAGTAGVADFKKGLATLIDALDETGPRLVFVSPPHRENLGPPLPDPGPYNDSLLAYTAAIREIAANKGCHFIDFFRPLGGNRDVNLPPSIRGQLTNNSVHFSDYGYWRTAPQLAAKLGSPPYRWSFAVSAADLSYDVVGATLQEIEKTKTGVRFAAVDRVLPYLPAPETAPRGGGLAAPHSVLRVVGLEPGEYGLQIDGRPAILAEATDWALGVHLNLGLYDDQLKRLHAAIQRKNELYFYRYRPQNETYLFLFRKHEQGNNAVEIPQFDPLIAEQEKLIEQLKIPQPKTFELIRLEPDEPSENPTDKNE